MTDFINTMELSGSVTEVERIAVRTGAIYKILLMQTVRDSEQGIVVKTFGDDGAAFCEDVQEGDIVLFRAHVESRLYEGKWLSDLVVDDYEVLERGAGETGDEVDAPADADEEPAAQADAEEEPAAEVADDDIPF